jgi:hypothetical protein
MTSEDWDLVCAVVICSVRRLAAVLCLPVVTSSKVFNNSITNHCHNTTMVV